MSNLFRAFRKLLPNSTRSYAQVTQVRSDGTTLVQSPEGRVYRVKGTGIPPGSYAFILGGELDGAAPSLPLSIFTE